MATLKDTLQTATGWLRSLTDFGLSLILTVVLVDLVFGTNYIVGNIGSIVAQFGEGVSGIIALLLFLLIYRR